MSDGLSQAFFYLLKIKKWQQQVEILISNRQKNNNGGGDFRLLLFSMNRKKEGFRGLGETLLPQSAPCNFNPLPVNMAFRTRHFKEFTENGIEIDHPDNFSFALNKLLPNVILKKRINAFRHLVLSF